MTGHTAVNHFEQILEMVATGSGAQRPVEDGWLSRYACYPSTETWTTATRGYMAG